MSSPGDASGRRCPICNKPQDAGFRPFCSRRCADIDLGRWLKGGYAIPAVETDDEAEQPGTEDKEGGG
ncbi:MAG TPA: DNA gyrase inhibitor YacG [Rhizomicrobium sp.]|jgi:hypothetical protein